MSNTYTKAAFTLLMSRDDAALLHTAQQAVHARLRARLSDVSVVALA